ncbi:MULTISPECIES: hypothetical protein [unclassified Microbacterium]|uniref:hypothetical protein n=1 Tax=unclassified Microbacterium TaxID=2609290 RepID=UPI00346780C0
MPVIAGSFLVLGAVLAFMFSSIQEKRRVELQISQRWDQDLREHVSAVIALSRQLRTAAVDFRAMADTMAIVAVDEMQHDESPMPPSEQIVVVAELTDTFNALVRECNMLRLVAPLGVRQAAETVWECASEVLQNGGDPLNGFAVENSLVVAVDELAESVREHFLIPGTERSR